MYNKELSKQYYLKNKEKIIKYQKDKYHETHVIKPRSFSEEEFQSRLKDNYGDKFKTLTPYINSRVKIKVKCNDCNYEWLTLSSSLLRGRGCKKCHILSKRKTNDKFSEEFTKNYGDRYELLYDYINANTKIKVKCKLCDNIWESKPYHLSHTKCECPKCASKNRGLKNRKTHDEFVNEVNTKFPNKYEVIGQYIKANIKIEIKCNICSNNWNIAPYSLLQGIGCPICNQSKGEFLISKYLIENNILYYSQHVFSECKYKNSLRFDFYLTEYNICIEYDGIQHFKSIEYFGGEERFKSTIEIDKIKNDFCKKNKIKMIRIPYTKLDNIDEILNKKIKK
jgi:Zn finger protein HypA/HybF involved in hydrogenase expression